MTGIPENIIAPETFAGIGGIVFGFFGLHQAAYVCPVCLTGAVHVRTVNDFIFILTYDKLFLG